jgi:FtsP/CotA-like multicopper oxidase with cupredoxin domain
MQTLTRNMLKLAVALLVLVAMFGAGFHSSVASAASCIPTVTKELWAKTGTATLYGTTSVTIWGYAAQSTDPAGLPGPVLDVNEGECVQVTLHNVNIPGSTSLLFQGQEMIPDISGVAAGSDVSYILSASSPGTFLYEAGLTPNGQHQVAMGLYGALIVRPSTPGQAYGDPSTSYDQEAVMVLSELDTALNSSADPAGFDMRNYSPRYFLINGKAFPGTDTFAITAGEKVLMRYVNAGLQAHAMSTLGLSQTIIAQDGSPYTYSHKVVAETIATGQTLDTIITIPATAADGSKFAVYDANMQLRNNLGTGSDSGFGGMLTFLAINGSGGGVSGPVTSNVVLTPNTTNGSSPVTLSATIGAAGDPDIDAAEYFVDTIGADGSGCAITTGLGLAPANVSATIPTSGGVAPCVDLGTLASGNRTFYVHGHNSNGWGAIASALLNLDKSGPAISSLSLSPNPSNGSVSVNLTFTASDGASGNSNVVIAEYWIDSDAAQSISVPSTAPLVNLSAVIPAGLSTGTHVVSVRAQDALGNWGSAATINLVVDQTGPVTSVVSAAPNPNNGAQGLNTSVQAVRVSANFDDTASGGTNIAAAEGFIDTVGPTGSGFVFIPSDGIFNSPVESGFGDIPLAVIGSLASGNHTLFVHARDAAGNWGANSTTVLVIDKTAPTFTGITLAPNPTYGATTVLLTVNGATDPVVGGVSTGVTGGEYWFGTTTPTPGGGTQFNGTSTNIDVSSLANGNYTINARIHDAVSNWSTIRSATLTIVPDAIFSDGFESGNTNAWSSRSTNSTGRLNVTTGAALVGTYGLQAGGNNFNYVQYNFGTTANPASTTLDARFYFRSNGNNSTGKDIFSAATSNTFGNTLFRVRYRLNGSTPQVQIQVGATNNPAWTNILGGSSNNVIEVVWQSGSALQLYVNGVLSQTLNASSGSVASFRLGSVTSTGNNTALYFDAFSSKRSLATLIGP